MAGNDSKPHDKLPVWRVSYIFSRFCCFQASAWRGIDSVTEVLLIQEIRGCAMEKLMDTLLVEDDVVELDHNDDLWWFIASSNWVLAGPR